MKKTVLFGKNIDVDCKYCANAVFTEKLCICSLDKKIKNGKCRKFLYNPTLRIPKQSTALPVYDESDFSL